MIEVLMETTMISSSLNNLKIVPLKNYTVMLSWNMKTRDYTILVIRIK